MQDPDDEYEDDIDAPPSKSAVKREMQALRALGDELTQLSAEQLARIPLSDTLKAAIVEAPKITQHSAKKRHSQFIGKLLRNADYQAIRAAYDALREGANRAARQLHTVERWRDRLLANEAGALESFIEQFPDCDRQQLRQLQRSACKEAAHNKPPASARKLFRFIRDALG